MAVLVTENYRQRIIGHRIPICKVFVSAILLAHTNELLLFALSYCQKPVKMVPGTKSVHFLRITMQFKILVRLPFSPDEYLLHHVIYNKLMP